MRLHSQIWAPGTTTTAFIATFAAILSLVALPGPASGQYFGRNKVQYETFDFKILKTPHFDIHFYPEEGEAVEDAARMGERWYERFARLFQHEFERPKPIILYADHPDFQQTNTLSGQLSEGTGGVTESLKNRVIMPLTGSYAATDHVLGHELVHAFQYNIAQSRAGSGLRGLMMLPLWLVEGMAEYLSVGREDPLTAMWLRDAIRREDLPTIKQMTTETRFFPYRFGEALWAFVGGKYGDEQIVRLYRRALRVGWEPAIEQVLGTSSDSLSAEWREAVESEYLPLMAGRQAPGESGALLLAPSTGAGHQNVSPSVSPDGRWVAFLSEKDLFGIELYIADARTGEIERKLVSANADPHFDALRFIDSAGDWSPDGSKFIFTVFAQGDNELAIVDVESGDIERKIDLDGIGAITSPSWSPDGQYIAFSGLDGGVSDIYTWDVTTGALRQLTDDKYSDFQPTWSPDGSTIAFMSDRGRKTNFESLEYDKPLLAFLDFETAQVTTLSVFGAGKHMNPQYAPDGRSIYFVSDQDGFSDIYQYVFTTADVRRITRLQTGVSGISAMSPAFSVARQAGTILFTVFDTFEFHVYSLQAGEADVGGEDVVSSLERSPGRILPPTVPSRSSRIASYLSDPLTGAHAEWYLPRRKRDRLRFVAVARLRGSTQRRFRHGQVRELRRWRGLRVLQRHARESVTRGVPAGAGDVQRHRRPSFLCESGKTAELGAFRWAGRVHVRVPVLRSGTERKCERQSVAAAHLPEPDERHGRIPLFNHQASGDQRRRAANLVRHRAGDLHLRPVRSAHTETRADFAGFARCGEPRIRFGRPRRGQLERGFRVAGQWWSLSLGGRAGRRHCELFERRGGLQAVPESQ